MTDQELKDLVASLAVGHANLTAEHANLMAEFAREHAKTEVAIQRLIESQAETSLQQKETDRQQKENAHQQKETDRQLRKHIKELSQQIGGLGNKFGGFAEGMAFPAMEKLLIEKLGMTHIAQRVRSLVKDPELELDVLAYSNTDINVAYIVEVKSHLKERDLEQVLKIMEKFPIAFPEHQNKALYGIVAVVDSTKEVKTKVLQEGLYLATIHEEQFKLAVPTGFKPKNFQLLQK